MSAGVTPSIFSPFIPPKSVSVATSILEKKKGKQGATMNLPREKGTIREASDRVTRSKYDDLQKRWPAVRSDQEILIPQNVTPTSPAIEDEAPSTVLQISAPLGKQ